MSEKVVQNGGLPGDTSLNGTTRYYYHGWRVLEERYGADYEETFTYDGLGRMLEAVKYRDTTHISTSEFEYNAFSKVTEATETILDADAVEIGYDYDQLGNLTGITYPDANDVTITREALGRIDTITLDGDTIASYKYIGSRVKRRSYTGPSVTYDIDYNGLGQATRHHTYTAVTNIADFEYEYDDNGNITRQEFNHRTSTPYNDYDYDDLDRLTEADYLVGVLTEDEQFTYDDLGNRTNVNLRSGSDESYSVDNLTNLYNSVGGNSLDYDDAGNLTQDPNGYEYEYDYENRLIEITKNSGATTVAEFEYDALGRRIEVHDNVADETTRYYYQGWRILSETDENGDQLRKYIYGHYLDEVLVKIEDGQEIYYAHNLLYSPVALVNENGNVVERYEYNAYGQRTIWDSSFSAQRTSSFYNNPISFTGQRLDSFDSNKLQNMYYKFRNYDPYLGRFIQNDPKGYVNGLNMCEYVLSRPGLYIDPYGLTTYAPLPFPIPFPGPFPVIPFPVPYPPKYSSFPGAPSLSTGNKNNAEKKCHRCGPDINKPLLALMEQVVADFDKEKSIPKKANACGALTGKDHWAGWDIPAIWDRDYDGVDDRETYKTDREKRRGVGNYDRVFMDLKKVHGCPTGKRAEGPESCYGSVEVFGGCHSASSVNYVLYGVMSGLCSYFRPKPIEDWKMMEDYKAMEGTIRLWKSINGYKGSRDYLSEAQMWAAYGFNWVIHKREGGMPMFPVPSMSVEHYKHCETNCIKYPSKLEYHWRGLHEKYERE